MRCTVMMNVTVRRRLQHHVPNRPNKCNFRRPARSMSQPETKVVSTNVTPTPIVAYGPTDPRLACLNRAVE